MYIDLNGKFEILEKGQQELKGDFQNLSNQMIRFENNMRDDIGALYDGYKLTYELAKDNNKKLVEISTKVDKQEVEIKVIKGGKKQSI